MPFLQRKYSRPVEVLMSYSLQLECQAGANYTIEKHVSIARKKRKIGNETGSYW
jgi:hypothetical protein